jgi:tetratricopeptide (TPR) repeat protein
MTIQKRTRLTVLVAVPLLGLWTAVGMASFDPLVLDGCDNPSRPATTQIENPVPPPQAAISAEERADIYMARKSYADAVDYYYRSLKQPGLSPSDAATIWNKLGIAFQQQNNYGAAQKAYQGAMRLRAEFSEPWNNMGTTYFMENNFKKSIKYYLHAIKLSPSSASFHMNLGTAYYHRKRYKDAVEEYKTALTLDPNFLSERSSGGTVMQTRGADADFYFYLAKSFAMVGRADEAVRYLRRAFEDGFKDQKRLAADPDIQKISQNPAYVELMKNLPVPIRD